MKKILNLLLVFIMLVGLMGNINAANIGDIVNSTLYTDIVAKINGHDIASYNIDGYTVVVAEDLRNYGFNVVWSEYDRSLYITKNESATYVTSTYVAPFVPPSQVGQKANDVLYSDIKTYMDGNLVTSYNIGGQTVIYFNDLQRYGGVSYDNNTRVLSIVLPWLAAPAASETPVGTTTAVTPATGNSSYTAFINDMIRNGKVDYDDDDGQKYYYLGDIFYDRDIGDVEIFVFYTPNDNTGFVMSVEKDGMEVGIYLYVDDKTGEAYQAIFNVKMGRTELRVKYKYDSEGALVVTSSDSSSINESAAGLVLLSYPMFDALMADNNVKTKMSDFGIRYY